MRKYLKTNNKLHWNEITRNNIKIRAKPSPLEHGYHCKQTGVAKHATFPVVFLSFTLLIWSTFFCDVTGKIAYMIMMLLMDDGDKWGPASYSNKREADRERRVGRARRLSPTQICEIKAEGVGWQTAVYSRQLSQLEQIIVHFGVYWQTLRLASSLFTSWRGRSQHRGQRPAPAANQEPPSTIPTRTQHSITVARPGPHVRVEMGGPRWYTPTQPPPWIRTI